MTYMQKPTKGKTENTGSQANIFFHVCSVSCDVDRLSLCIMLWKLLFLKTNLVLI